MAKRRRLGAALTAGSTVLRSLMDRKNTEQADLRRAALQLYTQQEMERARTENDLDQQAMTALTGSGGADLAERLTGGGIESLRGVTLKPFKRTGGERMTPLLEDIEGADTLNKLGTAQTTLARGQAAGLEEDPYYANAKFPTVMGQEVIAHPIRDQQTDIESLLRAQQSKKGALLQELGIQERAQPQYNPEVGAPGRFTRSGEFQQSAPTGAQAGEQEKAKMLGSTLDPTVVALEADKASEISGAQARASTRAGIEVRSELQDQIAETERRIAQARAQGQQVATGAAARDSQASASIIANRMIELATKLNTETRPGMARAKGVGQRIAGWSQIGFGQYDDETLADIDELQYLRESTRSMFARLLGHTGVLTQQDVEATERILPGLGRTPEMTKRNTAIFLEATKLMGQIGDQLGQIDQSLSMTAQQAEASRRLQMALSMLQSSLPSDAQVGDRVGDADQAIIEAEAVLRGAQ